MSELPPSDAAELQKDLSAIRLLYVRNKALKTTKHIFSHTRLNVYVGKTGNIRCEWKFKEMGCRAGTCRNYLPREDITCDNINKPVSINTFDPLRRTNDFCQYACAHAREGTIKNVITLGKHDSLLNKTTSNEKQFPPLLYWNGNNCIIQDGSIDRFIVQPSYIHSLDNSNHINDVGLYSYMEKFGQHGDVGTMTVTRISEDYCKAYQMETIEEDKTENSLVNVQYTYDLGKPKTCAFDISQNIISFFFGTSIAKLRFLTPSDWLKRLKMWMKMDYRDPISYNPPNDPIQYTLPIWKSNINENVSNNIIELKIVKGRNMGYDVIDPSYFGLNSDDRSQSVQWTDMYNNYEDIPEPIRINSVKYNGGFLVLRSKGEEEERVNSYSIFDKIDEISTHVIHRPEKDNKKKNSFNYSGLIKDIIATVSLLAGIHYTSKAVTIAITNAFKQLCTKLIPVLIDNCSEIMIGMTERFLAKEVIAHTIMNILGELLFKEIIEMLASVAAVGSLLNVVAIIGILGIILDLILKYKDFLILRDIPLNDNIFAGLSYQQYLQSQLQLLKGNVIMRPIFYYSFYVDGADKAEAAKELSEIIALYVFKYLAKIKITSEGSVVDWSKDGDGDIENFMQSFVQTRLGLLLDTVYDVDEIDGDIYKRSKDVKYKLVLSSILLFSSTIIMFFILSPIFVIVILGCLMSLTTGIVVKTLYSRNTKG